MLGIDLIKNVLNNLQICFEKFVLNILIDRFQKRNTEVSGTWSGI